MNSFLRNIPLFAGLSDSDLEQLCHLITEIRLEAGEELFAEGDMGQEAYIIKEGEIEIYKFTGSACILLATRKAGEIIGEMSIIEASPRNASGRARTASVLLVISHQQLNELLDKSPSAARSMLETFTARLRSMELTLQQSEKMAQLGVLTAGISHELNNPAAAVLRGSNQLKQALERYQEALVVLSHFKLDDEQRHALEALNQATANRPGGGYAESPLKRSDNEEKLELWLDQMGVDRAWELAPVLSELNLTPEQLLERLGPFIEKPGHSDQRLLSAVLDWVSANHLVSSLLAEVNQGAGRIADTVKALKSYVYLDQAPVQQIDVHEGLENTVTMLRGALKNGDIQVLRDYTPDLPRIEAYGSELNQVWTNIIANAIDALKGQGEITLRTRLRDRWVLVEIEDNGPGIPDEIQPKIFSPFFTTKAMGSGTGLGLHISYNIIQKHKGDIRVVSRPGKTTFVVTLPLQVQEGEAGSEVSPIEIPEGDQLGT